MAPHLRENLETLGFTIYPNMLHKCQSQFILTVMRGKWAYVRISYR